LELFKSVKREHPNPHPPTSSRSPSPIRDRLPPSVYVPLEEGEFRLLQLAPGRIDDKIVCSFVIASRNKLIEYEAISYVRLHQKSVEIHLQDSQGKIYPVFIRSNLHAALRNFRHPKHYKYFWADALCVSHSDTAEKSRFVLMRHFVFRNAVNVCFWFGEDESSTSALKFAAHVNLTGFKSLVRDCDAIDGLVAFVALLKNPVFSVSKIYHPAQLYLILQPS
jgi:hypothetical protein